MITDYVNRPKVAAKKPSSSSKIIAKIAKYSLAWGSLCLMGAVLALLFVWGIDTSTQNF